jgi:hypothetical protein
MSPIINGQYGRDETGYCIGIHFMTVSIISRNLKKERRPYNIFGVRPVRN